MTFSTSSRKKPLRRTAIKPTGFKSRTPERRTAVYRDVAKTSVQLPKRMKSAKEAPNAAERKWMAAVADLGCIVCLLFHGAKTPCAVHHLVEGGRRLGHLFTIGLCDPGHHQNTPDRAVKVSRHPTKARFEEAYGTEYELLAKTQELLRTAA